MLKMYGTLLCPDCRNAQANMDVYHIPYEKVDIFASMPNFKEFLKLRDHEEIFADVKESGSVGIPCFMKDDGTITLDWQGVIREFGYEPVLVDTGAACSADHSGNC